jgi:hypothetical protein
LKCSGGERRSFGSSEAISKKLCGFSESQS